MHVENQENNLNCTAICKPIPYSHTAVIQFWDQLNLMTNIKSKIKTEAYLKQLKTHHKKRSLLKVTSHHKKTQAA